MSRLRRCRGEARVRRRDRRLRRRRAARRRRLRRRRARTPSPTSREAAGGLELPTLERLGLGSIIPLRGRDRRSAAPSLHGRLHALGPGKDSTAGHWELMGVVMRRPLPTYPDGFPDEVVELIGRLSGRDVLCNRPSNGIEAIEHFGEQHLETRRADRLHEPGLGPPDRRARRAGAGRGAVRGLPTGPRADCRPSTPSGRVIARPFEGVAGRLSADRRPPGLLGRAPVAQLPGGASGRGVEVHTVGKVGQLFAGRRRRRAAPGRDQRARAR